MIQPIFQPKVSSPMKTLICNCNQTMPLDMKALGQALGQTDPHWPTHSHTALCRREAAQFQQAAKTGEDLLVACTQESRLFLELNDQTQGAASLEERPIRFVNIRETAAWSREGQSATAKIAALIAAAKLPVPQAVENVSYHSAGRCLVVGSASAAEAAAQILADKLDVTVLALANQGGLAQRHDLTVHTGELVALQGHLGAFTATWQSNNPIDLDLCTRCNACIAACPENAIDFSYSIDLSRCQSHRSCVQACEVAGAIAFDRPPRETQQNFDLVLDLRAQPAFTQHAMPQGYFHVTGDALRLAQVLMQLRDMVGTFDKPKFFRYRSKLCAHSRNEQIGCTACIDVCSAKAVRSDAALKGKTFGQHRAMKPVAPLAGGQGGGIVVDPHLCVGCGACTTVCPTGALGYALPDVVDQGRRMRTLLDTYRSAGGKDAALLIHSEGAGQQRVESLGRQASLNLSVGASGNVLSRLLPNVAAHLQARGTSVQGAHAAALGGLPARVLPLAVWHTASIGLDLWLTAIAQGASQVWVLTTEEEAPAYLQALQEQMAVGQALLEGLGYSGDAGTHLRVITLARTGQATAQQSDSALNAALDTALQAAPAKCVGKPMAASAMPDKRPTLDAALEHLLAQAPALRPNGPTPQATPQAPLDVISLPSKGAPWGSLQIDADKCTMCLSCVGACPSAALADNPDKPQLRFIEKNCVQCGLCAKTCPEEAISLVPRLWLADEGKARKSARVLHEVKAFHCIRCSKPFGTLPAIEAMVLKIGSHPAFAGAAADRLRMCSDCRVVDMFSNPNEVSIKDIR